MAKSNLTAQERNDSLNPRQLRRSGKIPATLYGKDSESLSLELDTKEFAHTYKKDKNAIFSINVGKKSYDSVVKKVQTKTLKDEILNVEFQKVRKGDKIKMVIPIELIEESPAVKSGGNLITNLTELEVECLPGDIPSSLQIDLSKFENFDDSITIEELNYPKGVEPTGSPETVVVRVSAPEAEEVESEAAKEGVEAVEGAEVPAEEETSQE